MYRDVLENSSKLVDFSEQPRGRAGSPAMIFLTGSDSHTPVAQLVRRAKASRGRGYATRHLPEAIYDGFGAHAVTGSSLENGAFSAHHAGAWGHPSRRALRALLRMRTKVAARVRAAVLRPHPEVRGRRPSVSKDEDGGCGPRPCRALRPHPEERGRRPSVSKDGHTRGRQAG